MIRGAVRAAVLFIVFSSVSHAGSAAQCSGLKVLTATRSGVILTDGSGPTNNYPPNTSCTWRIESSPDTRINLTFTQFSTAFSENSFTSKCDAVILYDGPTVQSVALGYFCEQYYSPFSMFSTGNRMFVTFSSGVFYSGTPEGFFGIAQEIPLASCRDGLTVNATRGGILATSPDSSLPKYPNLLSCSWQVTARPGKSIRFTFTSFETEIDYDALKFYFGTELVIGFQLARLSGGPFSPYPPIVQFPYSSIYVVFTSDASITKSGFRAVVSEATPAEGSCNGLQLIDATVGGVIQSARDGKVWYGPHANCTWTVTARPGYVILFVPTVFSLIPGDAVAILDGPSFLSPILLTLPWDYQPPEYIRTTTNSATVLFYGNAGLDMARGISITVSEVLPPPASPTLKPSATPTLKRSATSTLKRSATLTLKRSATSTLKRSPTLTLKRSATLTLKRSATITLKRSTTPSVRKTIPPTKRGTNTRTRTAVRLTPS